jgi:hypothetical protein
MSRSHALGAILAGSLLFAAGCVIEYGGEDEVAPPPKRTVKKTEPARTSPATKQAQPAEQPKFVFGQAQTGRVVYTDGYDPGRFSTGGGGMTGYTPTQTFSSYRGMNEREAVQKVAEGIREAAEFRPTLVVWVLDRSNSASALVRDSCQEIRSFYGSLGNKAAGAGGIPPGSLLTAVVSFAEKVAFPLEEPTDDANRAMAAIDSVRSEMSATEMTFTAMQAAAEKYLPYRSQGRDVIFVLITDEVGDDFSIVDTLGQTLRRSAAPVYVIGPPAAFGLMAHAPQTMEPRPSDGSLAVRQGPESRYQEQIALAVAGRAWGSEMMDSGFGPFSLEMLARNSGGRFLAVSPRDSRIGFSDEVMRKYAPDYVTEAEYQALLQENKARMALHRAAKLPPADATLVSPTVDFPKRDEAQLKRELDNAQRAAARLEPEVAKLYDALKDGESDRARLTGPRWQAAFDLAMGRVLAAKARVEGYNAMLALLKNGRQFKNPSSNAWLLVYDENIEAGSVLQKNIERSKEYLTRVVKEHPGTPWSAIAEQELQVPMGWRWEER